MTQVTAKQSYIKDADGSYVVPYVNPADNTNLGVVKPDGTTITVNNGVLSTNNKNLAVITAYPNEGELLTDSEGLQDVTDYAHSTFDVSKFTVVGSPNITNDGIASGFSGSNYIDLSSVISNISSSYESVTYNIEVYTGNDVTSDQKIISYNGLSFYLTIYGGSIRYYYAIDNTGWTKTGVVLETATANTKYNYSVTFTQTGATISGGGLSNPVNITDGKVVILPSRIGWGQSGQGASQGFLGSIDLKQFSITVDGVEVFSGNKTGIDTIKPNNFTPEGLIEDTITPDGIASGFSSSNYITGNTFNITNATSWDVEGEFTTPSALSGSQQYIFAFKDSDGAYASGINFDTNIKPYVADSQGELLTSADGYTAVNVNTTYIYKLSYNSTNGYKFYFAEKGNSLTLIASNATTRALNYGNADVLIGQYGGSNPRPFGGSIDLNSFKIYVDGDLVYQPCLKIPYTESKTGSKIVDSIYRDRVNDMAEQFGYAPYYTLSDSDFTLPQVELYGMIEKLSNRPDYGSSITTSDINGSSNVYTIGGKSLAIIKPSTPASTYTISVKQAWDTSYKTINGYGYMTLMFDAGDVVYTSASATMDVYLIR